MRGKRATGRNMGNLNRETDARWESRQARAAVAKDDAWLPVLANPGACWCGQPYPHPWPGKAEGQPHPRTAPR